MPIALQIKPTKKFLGVIAVGFAAPYIKSRISHEKKLSYADTLSKIRSLRNTHDASPSFVRAVKALETQFLTQRSTPFNL